MAASKQNIGGWQAVDIGAWQNTSAVTTGAIKKVSTILWANALTWANGLNFAGYTDWRLPTITELQSIVIYNFQEIPGVKTSRFPYIHTGMFPNTSVTQRYFSSTTYAENTARTMRVSFSTTLISQIANTTVDSVRAVRNN